MSYDYQREKGYTLTDEGSKEVIKLKNYIDNIIDKSGVMTAEACMEGCNCGTNWQQLACIDRLVEIGELFEVNLGYEELMGQARIFAKWRKGGFPQIHLFKEIED